MREIHKSLLLVQVISRLVSLLSLLGNISQTVHIAKHILDVPPIMCERDGV